MAKLTRIPERVSGMPDRVKPLPKVALPFYHSPEWRALVRKVKSERGNWCQRCGSTHRIIPDHIEEIRDGGDRLSEANIELLCQRCHQGKTARVQAARVGKA